MINVSSVTNVIPNKVTSSTDSVVTILSLVLGNTWTVTNTSGVYKFENSSGKILEITESTTSCTVVGKHAGTSFEFPSNSSESLHWYKSNGEWEIFYDENFFYFCMENSLNYFGNFKSDTCVLSGKRNSGDSLFYTNSVHPDKVGYADKSAFSLVSYSQEVSFVPELSPFNPFWRHVNGQILVNSVAIYDSRKRSLVGYLPGLWVLQPDFPEEMTIKTGSGKNLKILFREDFFLGFEV